MKLRSRYQNVALSQKTDQTEFQHKYSQSADPAFQTSWEKFSHERMTINDHGIHVNPVVFHLPGTVGHLMGAVEHSHQRFLVVDAGQHNDHRCVGDDQIQVVFGEVKVDCLKLKGNNHPSGPKTHIFILKKQQHIFTPLNLTFEK